MYHIKINEPKCKKCFDRKELFINDSDEVTYIVRCPYCEGDEE